VSCSPSARPSTRPSSRATGASCFASSRANHLVESAPTPGYGQRRHRVEERHMSDASYDVVVVGMGGAGLCAALSYAETAKEQSRTARIAVLERAPREERGGATRYTTARIRID